MTRHSALLLMLVVAVPGFAQTFKVDPVANPSSEGSLQPNWSTTSDGSPLLSWVEKLKDGSYNLRYSVHRGTAWSEARTVAAHRQFFRHPAELPEVLSLSDGSLLAHWIEMPEAGGESEFLYVSASKDGLHWTPPVMASKDQSQAQHGLASMAESGKNEVSIMWLEALKGEDGPTTLKRSIVSFEGKMIREENLDTDVCACCPTSIVKTAKGMLVAYRDHTPADIRDISTTRLEGGHWTPAKNLNPDNWKINACPTNAAVAAAKGDRVVIAWYTASQSKPRAQVAFSTDGGSTFSKPVVVSTGSSFGYVSVVLDDENGALVSWLERGANGARVLVRPVASTGALGPVIQVAQAARAGLGYPRLVHAGKETWITWGSEKVQTARLTK